jgi:hypothetical protein
VRYLAMMSAASMARIDVPDRSGPSTKIPLESSDIAIDATTKLSI